MCFPLYAGVVVFALLFRFTDYTTRLWESEWKKSCRGCWKSGPTGTLLGSRSGRAGFKDGAGHHEGRGTRESGRLPKGWGTLRLFGTNNRKKEAVWQVPGTRIVTAIQKPEILFHYYATSEWNRYIRGNEYIPLLESRQPLAERRIDPLLCNVKAWQRFPKQRYRYNAIRMVMRGVPYPVRICPP
jgi:hypothetical protein